MAYQVRTKLSEMDFEVIYQFISTSYWAAGIPREVLEKALRNSLCFGLFAESEQIGFARLITDHATFAYLADVFILPAFRGKGLAKVLMDQVMDHAQSLGLRRIMLSTQNAHGLYAKYNFQEIEDPTRLMQLHFPDVYRNAV